MDFSRRCLLTGFGSLVVSAPAIVRASSLMRVRAVRFLTAEEIVNEAVRRLSEVSAASLLDAIDFDAVLCELGAFGNSAIFVQPGEARHVTLRDCGALPE